MHHDDVNTLTPSFIHDDATVLVGLKKKLTYDHYHMTGSVCPLETMKAINVLLDTSLYKDNKVMMNKEWKKHIEKKIT